MFITVMAAFSKSSLLLVLLEDLLSLRFSNLALSYGISLLISLAFFFTGEAYFHGPYCKLDSGTLAS